jgi:cyclase
MEMGNEKRPLRLIARLDIKGANLIKSIQLEGLRVLGDPQEFAERYYQEGIDELIYMDAVASLYGRNSIDSVLQAAIRNVFVPLTAGGGIRSLDDADRLLRSGADKIAINTAAIQRPALIDEVARHFGSQCMVLSIEAKRGPHGNWEAFANNGREKTGRNVVEWAREGQLRGAGEILLTSVDREGTQKGFDVEVCRAVVSAVDIPVILSGGMGTIGHLQSAVIEGRADAIAMAHVLHYQKISLRDIRGGARETGCFVRNP